MNRESKFASLPFGFGPRMCAGRRFAELELIIATAKLVLNFKMETPTDEELEKTHAFIVIPSHPIQIRFQSRFQDENLTRSDRLSIQANGS